MERHLFDRNAPQGSKSLSNTRNSMRGLFQGDLMAMQPKASLLLDGFEYPTDASIQAVWSGTGCTVTAEATTVTKGNFAGNIVIDGTGNRTLSKTHTIDMSIFSSVTVWEQCDAISSAFKFYAKDSSANESYWNITSNGSADTWQKDTLDLTTADSNNGTDADLSDIVEYGFTGLDASATYIFDDIELVCGMGIIVETSHPGSYYKNVYVGSSPLEAAAAASPSLTAPVANPRIDILVVDSAGTLSWVAGSEAGSPVPDWSSVPTTKMPLCLVYCKTTMVKVVDYENAAANPNEGYIYADVRPLYRMGIARITDASDVDDSGITDGQALVWDSGTSKYIPGDVIPSGLIGIWSGTLANIPSGWSLCDGNGGRPNLLDKFLLGVPNGSTDPGSTGGAHTVTLIEANLPSHNHTISSAGAHTHSVSGTAATENASHRHNISGLGNSGEHGTVAGTLYNATSSKYTDYANASHSHSVSGTAASDGSHSHTCSSVGSGTSFSIDPPYYKVAFIWKD